MSILRTVITTVANMLDSSPPVSGTPFACTMQRVLHRLGYTIAGHEGDTVYFTFIHAQNEHRASVSLLRNCIANVSVIGGVMIDDNVRFSVESLLSGVRSRSNSAYEYQLIPIGNGLCHVISWTVALDLIKPEYLQMILPEMATKSQLISDYVYELYRNVLAVEARR